jgi:hypothetical protein
LLGTILSIGRTRWKAPEYALKSAISTAVGT